MHYPELNPHGLTDYHHKRLCYPYTDVPAFKFWEPAMPGATMSQWQDGRCGLCGFREQLVKDHCHDTGMVRGLICRSCNTTDGVGDGHNLNKWRDGVTVAAELGIEEVYVNPVTRTTPMRPQAGDMQAKLAAMSPDELNSLHRIAAAAAR